MVGQLINGNREDLCVSLHFDDYKGLVIHAGHFEDDILKSGIETLRIEVSDQERHSLLGSLNFLVLGRNLFREEVFTLISRPSLWTVVRGRYSGL